MLIIQKDKGKREKRIYSQQGELNLAIRRSSSSGIAFQSFFKADSSLGSLVRNILSDIVYDIY